jgi:hypothetical protein
MHRKALLLYLKEMLSYTVGDVNRLLGQAESAWRIMLSTPKVQRSRGVPSTVIEFGER